MSARPGTMEGTLLRAPRPSPDGFCVRLVGAFGEQTRCILLTRPLLGPLSGDVASDARRSGGGKHRQADR